MWDIFKFNEEYTMTHAIFHKKIDDTDRQTNKRDRKSAQKRPKNKKTSRFHCRGTSANTCYKPQVEDPNPPPHQALRAKRRSASLRGASRRRVAGEHEYAIIQRIIFA